MANIVYRKSTVPTANPSASTKGSPLTNDELDGNFKGLDDEVQTKAPINNAVFTGSTTIPSANINGGTINGTTIGNVTPSPATFSSVTTTGNVSVGNSSDDVLSIQAGAAASPSLIKSGDTNTGIWFPADDIIAVSTGGVERFRVNTGVEITGNANLSGDLGVNGGDITTTATSFNLINTNASTVNFAGAGTAIVAGATTGSFTVRNPVVLGTQTSQDLWNTVATTVNFAGAATTLNVGNSASAQTISIGNASTGASTYNLGTGATAAATTKTVNIGTGGAASSTTNVNIGSVNGGTTTINSATVVGAGATQTLWNTVATSITFGGAATTLNIGNASAAQTVNIANASTGASTYNFATGATASATTKTLNIGTGGATGSTTNVNIGSVNGGTTTINSATVVGAATSQTVWDTVATTVNFAGAATTLNIGNGTAATVTLRPGTVVGSQTTQNLWNTVATTINFGGVASLTIGASGTGTTTIRNATTAISNALTVGTTASITGNTTVGGTLGVNGNSSFIGDVSVNTNKFVVLSSSGNTSIAGTLSVSSNATVGGTLGVTGATTLTSLSATSGSFSSTISSSNTITGTRFISTQSNGTAPLTVTSTTKVANLNADRVDDIDFNTVSFSAGGVPYISDASNRTISFINSGVNGPVLTSSGGGAPQWTAISGLSAGSSFSTRHVLGGNTGDMLYQNVVSTNVSTTAGSKTVTMTSTSGILSGMIVEENPNIPTGAYVQTVDSATQITITENATGTASNIATKFLETKKLPIGSTNNVLVVNGGVPAWSNTLSVNGISHAGLTPTAGTNIDQVYSVTDSLTLNSTGWFNTSVNAAELATGSYMVQVTTGSEIYTGMMSWFAGDTSSAVVDEIVLHRASTGTEGSNLFLRIERTDNDTSPDMTLQVSSSVARTVANYTFKFRRMM